MTPQAIHPLNKSFVGRCAVGVVQGVALALPFAFASFALLILINTLMPSPDPWQVDYVIDPHLVEEVLSACALGLTHAVFISMIARRISSRHNKEPFRHSLTESLLPGLRMTPVVALFLVLDTLGSQYTCADGQIFDRSVVPLAPWLLIGWVGVNATGLSGWLFTRNSKIWSWAALQKRAIPLAAFGAAVASLAYPFQWREYDCTPPFDGFGLFEGGLFLIPLFALFGFVLSLSTAAIASLAYDAEPQ